MYKVTLQVCAIPMCCVLQADQSYGSAMTMHVMRATKLVSSVKNLSFKNRLEKLEQSTLTFTRIRGDMIEVYL